MPSIVAVPYPTRGHVLLEINFADVPTATHVCVEATDTVTGLTRPLHSYVSYNSDGCIALSCGQAILWDTEINCGNPTVYCATAIDAAGAAVTLPADPLLTATFSTVAVASWPPADTGQAFTNSGGAAADYSGTGTRGQHAVTTVNVRRMSSAPITTPNYTATVVGYPTVLATGDLMTQELLIRADTTGTNGYRLRVRYFPSGNIDLVIERIVAGVATGLASAGVVMTYTATTPVAMELTAHGGNLRGRIWNATTPVPAYQLTATDNTFNAVAGVVLLGSSRSAGNTNGTVNMQWDDLIVLDVCADTVPVETCTEEITIACDGCFRLGNPVRPCDDVRICLCADGVACGGDGGLSFVAMTPDTRASNSGSMVPVNDTYPITVSRRRMKPTSNLTVVPTSFAARDQLINLLAPGEPLLLRTTPEFGIGNRYLQIGDVPETYQIADMTIQPRIMNLPNAEVRGPVGPSLGVCGARVVDLCDVYPTWDALAAAGLTWADLLRGNASTTPAGLETWDSVNAENASWNALQAAQTDWSDVLDGD